MYNRNRPRARVVALLFVVMAASYQVHGQSGKGGTRIRFKRGQSSTTIKGQLSSRKLERVFLIGAQTGQELHLKITARTSDGLDFALLLAYDPSGKPLGSTQDDLRIRLKQTGNYRLEISPPGSFYRENVKGYKELQFTLFVEIQ
jgi:hypothetical protein